MTATIGRQVKAFLLGYTVFFALAMGSVFLARLSDDVAIFWPANAAIVALAMVMSQRNLVALVLAAYIANATTQVMFGDQWMAILGFPLANATEIVCMFLLMRWLGIGLSKEFTPNFALKLLGAVATAAVPAALVGSHVVLALFGASVYDTFIHWWAGDIVSSMIVYMPLFAFARKGGWNAFLRMFDARRLREWTIVALSCVVGFFVLVAIHLPPAIVLLFPTLWLALRGRVLEVALISSVLSLATSAAVVIGIWPSLSADLSLRDAVFQQQTFSLFCTFPTYLIAIAVENLQRLQIQTAQRNDILNLMLSNMNEGVSMFDQNGRLTLWNQKYLDIFGMKEEDVSHDVGFTELLELQRKNGDFEGDPQELQNTILGYVNRDQIFTGETILNTGRYIKSHHAPTPVGGWIGTHEDVTHNRLLEERLAFESRHDALTGLANRRYFDQEYSHQVKVSREGENAIALFTIDLDRFKTINDSYGHDVGDAVLVWAADILRTVVDEAGFVARIGGDEFMVIVSEDANEHNLRSLAKALLAKLNEPLEVAGHTFICGASIGIAYAPDGQSDKDHLMTQSDIALYSAKQSGRNIFKLVNFANSKADETQVLAHGGGRKRAAG